MRFWAFRRVGGLLFVSLLMSCGEAPSDAGALPASEAVGEMSPAELERLRALGYVDAVEEVVDTPEMGVQVLDRSRVAPGYRLYVEKMLCRATLMDIDGHAIREWRTAGCRRWVQAELLPNGDLLVPGVDWSGNRDRDEANDDFRYLMRLNWNGDVIWKARIPTHHDAEQMPDGRIVALTRSDRRDHPFGDAYIVKDNNLVLLSADGEQSEAFSLWDVLRENDIGFKLLEVAPNKKTGVIDILHTNSVEFMRRPELVGRHPIYDLDNVLVSVRHQDSIVVINFRSRKLVWAWGQGELSSQHDARVLDSGNILVFDNGIRKRWSRVVEMDPLTGEIVWEYGDGDQHRFYTEARGSNQRLPNGNTLIAVSNRGEAREVTPEGEVVWKFHTGRPDDESKRQVIVRMHHYPPERIAPLIARSSG